MVDRAGCEWEVSLVFLYDVTIFLIDYTPSITFIFLSSYRLFFSWSGGCGGVGGLVDGKAPPLSHSLHLPAHFSFSRWHPLPTHLHCVPITHSGFKCFVEADVHTMSSFK